MTRLGLVALLVGVPLAVLGVLRESTPTTRAAEPLPRFASDGADACVVYEFDLAPRRGRPVEGLELRVALPLDIPGRQRVLDVRASHPVAETSRWMGHRVATFRWPTFEEATTLEVVVDLTVAGYSLDAPPPRRPPSDDERRRYLAPAEGIESDDPTIVDAAAAIPGATDLAFTQAAFDWLVENIAYDGFVSDRPGARKVLETRSGDCSDSTDLMVALCRARGIPARHAYGFALERGASVKHSWAEVWCEAAGWIPLDVLYTKLGDARFGALGRDHVQVMNTPEDERIAPYWFYRWVTDEGSVTAKDRSRVLLR